MFCPKCEGSTTVLSTYARLDGTVTRRRECLDCSFRFTTREQIIQKPVEEPEEIKIQKPRKVISNHFLDIALAPLEKRIQKEAGNNGRQSIIE